MEYIREQRKVFIPKQVSWFYGVPKINNGKILNFDFMPNISWMISVNCKDAIEFLIQCKKNWHSRTRLLYMDLSEENGKMN